MKGVANHASKAYEFSHFLPYSDPLPSQMPFEREGKTILPKPFSYDNVSISVSDSEFEAEDKVESIYGIEDEVQWDLDLYPIEAQSQYQYHVDLVPRLLNLKH